MKKYLELILNICIIVALFFVIFINDAFPSIWSIRNEKEQSKLTFTENDDRSKTKFYDLNTIKMFDDRIYCFSEVSNLITVLSKNGKVEKLIQLPYKDHAVTKIYVMNDCLCIIDVNGVLYQYSSFDEYQKIILKGKKIRIYDKEDNMINEKNVQKTYDEIMFYDEESYIMSFYNFDTQLLDVYYKDSLYKQQKADYEELTKDQKTIKDDDATYKIGKLKNNYNIPMKKLWFIILMKMEEILFHLIK